MRTVVTRLNILLELPDKAKLVASVNDEAPELMTELRNAVIRTVLEFGFTSSRAIDVPVSRRNDGWAYYDTYTLETDECKILVGIDVRSANHASKPNLKEKNKMRLDKAKYKFPEDTPIELIDTYYQERDWGAQYYIGKGNNYSDPVDSLDKLIIMLKGQLNKIVSKYTQE